MTDEFETRETLAERTPPFKTSPVIHSELEASWARPDVFVKTGMRGLDTILRGGLRRGECIALAGSAGQGKSSLAIQLAIEAARSGGVAIYCTVEMPHEEILARTIAREMFTLASSTGSDWAAGFGDVLIGSHVRGVIESEAIQTEVSERYQQASEVLHRDVYPRLVVHALVPGSTVANVAELVVKVRAELGFKGLVVLVIDPLQRLFASEGGARTGRALETINANETERMGAVVQELKHLADTQELAAVFTSDTTKAAVLGDAQGDGLELRWSYQLAHLATVILTLRAGKDAEDLAKRTEKIAGALDAATLKASAPEWIRSRADAVKLGGCYALLHCGKARRGPPATFAMGFIPGAGAFVEGELEIAPSTSKKPAKAKKTPSVAVKLSAVDSKRVADAIIADLPKPEPVEEKSTP